MQSTPVFEQSAAQLTVAGIQAIQAGDIAQAYTLLSQALRLNPRDQQAWLWLSGAVVSASERRYCLEQVLALNPHNADAQRGLAALPSVATMSPLPATAAFSGATVKLQPDDLAAWGVPAQAFAEAVPAMASAAPAPAANPATYTAASYAPAAATYKQADIDFVIDKFGKHLSRDQIARTLAEQRAYSWNEAVALVRHVANTRGSAVAARKLPLYLLIGTLTFISGLALVVLAGFALSNLPALTPRSQSRAVFALGMGVFLMLSAGIGMIQCLRDMWRA